MSRRQASRGPDAVALVLAGDELLRGDVADSNGAWLSRTLTGAGLRVVSVMQCADDTSATVVSLRRALADAPSVIVSGGLGPTPDDVTRQALADLAGVPLRRDADAAASMQAWYARRGAAVPDAARPMADLPAGAAAIRNDHGSAPGVRLDVRVGLEEVAAGASEQGVVYAVPGVPAELRAMVEQHVLSDLVTRAGQLPPRATRVLHVSGLGESQVSELLAGLEPGVEVSYLAAAAAVRVRLAAAGDAPLQAAVASAREVLGQACHDEPVEVEVHRLLRTCAATLATAESLTGGLLGAALTAVPGSSATYRGGVVAYASELKHALLDVPGEVLTRYGAVDLRTAAAMARGARDKCGTTYGLATTGVAGPDRQDGHPPGKAYVALDGPGHGEGVTLRLAGDRDTVRAQVVTRALDLLRRHLLGRLAAESSVSAGR